ncbi:hypothetical protein ACQ4PT_031714 [Festuca glaucescens]
MSGRRRRRRGRGTHTVNPATAEGIIHQGGGGGGDGGTGEPRAADEPLVGESEGVGGGGRGVRAPAAGTPADGGLHLGAEGGEGGNDGILRAAANVINGQPHSAARTAEVMQCQVAADGGGRDGDAEIEGDQALVSPKGNCFPNEEAAIKLPPSQPDAKVRANTNNKGGCYSGAIDGRVGKSFTLVERKEGQDADDGGRSSADQVINSWKDECFVLDAVMRWRVEDVMNADLFKEKVKEMPSTFSSLQHYLNIHRNLLLEETRASINIGLFDLVKGKTYHALSISPTATPYVHFIDIDLKKSVGCSHIAKDGDLFLLHTQPQGGPDHTSGCFALATEVGPYPCFQKGFRAFVSKYHNDFNFKEIKHVSFLTNIMGGITLSKAITSVERGGSTAVESILWIDKKAKTKVCSCAELAVDEISPPNKFNDNQRNALKCILSRLRCPHMNVPEVLWGCPGSGKTELEDRKKLEDFCLGHSRVIICTPYSSRLLQLKLTRFDTLLVDDASQMKESDLFIPLSMAPKHVVLLGDHLRLQPTVKSEVCKKMVTLPVCLSDFYAYLLKK